jgi:sortase A
VNLHATVLEGSDTRTLARAAGRIKNTARPGEHGNIGIAGHRDTVFRPLRRIKEGDELKLETSRATYTYRVSRTSIVDPHDVHVLAPTGQPTLTLVTCYPFTFVGKAPRRFIVHARLVKAEVRN